MKLRSTCLGFPRIGPRRELKWALEKFWRGQTSSDDLRRSAAELRERHWRLMSDAGISDIPSNDFSLYDHMLDMALALGAVPARYRDIRDPLARYFAMARGLQDRESGIDVSALEMTKWFDTNYHYIVPELEPTQQFELDASKILDELESANSLGLNARPVVIGPVTFLMLSKITGKEGGNPLQLLKAVLPAYEELLGLLADKGVEWVQVDEPCLVLDLEESAREAYRVVLPGLAAFAHRPKIMITTYFGPLRENMPLVIESGCEGLHIDLTRSPEDFDAVLKRIGAEVMLSLGVIDGRNIWRTDLEAAQSLIRRAVQVLGEDRVIVATSCSLLHIPYDVEVEPELDDELKSWLAFAIQKLGEVAALANPAGNGGPATIFTETRRARETRNSSPRTHDTVVRQNIAAVNESMLHRRSAFAKRRSKQGDRLNLPTLPTTTIGSFPQTREVRRARADWRSGKMPNDEYQQFVKDQVRNAIEKQLELGLDVLVHGEFERNDMVEYFGEQLSGFAFTKIGWVQSYGSRCVKPPILYGDVSRPQPITVELARYAQSLTDAPVKGMLTGPVTIIQWSFVRDDQPRSDTAMQVALALRDEVLDLESAGITIIQVDEPAIREGLPLRRDERANYLGWAVASFRLATSGVSDVTQIHTHMCYSEFGEILDSIADLDADVLSIESSRSGMVLLGDFAKQGYPNDVGPGVYDIHSPRIPPVEEIEELLRRSLKALPAEKIWVNPDCGLKTRDWAEVEQSLENMVEAATRVRESIAGV